MLLKVLYYKAKTLKGKENSQADHPDAEVNETQFWMSFIHKSPPKGRKKHVKMAGIFLW